MCFPFLPSDGDGGAITRRAALCLLLLLLFLLAPAGAKAAELNLTSFGAVPDDGVDDAPALQAALEALADAGGGTLVFPAGQTDILSPVSKDFQDHQSAVTLTGAGSTVHVSVPADKIGLDLRNLSTVLIEKLVFRGTLAFEPWELRFFDASRALLLTSCGRAVVRDCDFYGVAGSDSVVSASDTELSVEDSSFRGCHAGVGVVTSDDWPGLTVRRVDFIDYGTLGGGYFSKSTAFPPSWIYTGTPKPSVDENTKRRVAVEEVRLDEGAARAIVVGAGADEVSIKGTSINLNSAESAIGIWLNGVKRTKVEQSWLGFTEQDRPGVKAVDCDLVELDSVKFGGGVSHVWTEGQTDWLVLRHCDIPSNASYPQGVRNDGHTRVELLERNPAGPAFSGGRSYGAVEKDSPGVKTRAVGNAVAPKAAAKGLRVSLESFGAVPDDGVDDAPALQAALEALAATDGGAIVFPAGQTDILSPVARDFLGQASYVTLTGSGSTVHVSLAQGESAIVLSNLTTVLVEKLTFLGTQAAPGAPEFYDVEQVIQVSSVLRTTVRDCHFYGVAATYAVLTAFSTDLHMEDSSFQGCYSPEQVLSSHDWRGLTLRRVEFLNSGTFDGVLYSKSSNVPLAWLASGQPKALTDANSQRRVLVEDVKMESAARVGVNVWGGAEFVTVKGLTVDVSDVEGAVGVSLAGVRRAKVEQSSFGHAQQDRPGLHLFDCDLVELEGVRFTDGVSHVWTEGQTNWLLINHSLIPAGDIYPLGVRNEGNTQVEVVANRPVSTIQFGALSFNVKEGERFAFINATRTGENFEPATFDFRTGNGTANAPADYTSTFKAVRFAAGETSTSIPVPIADDEVYEGTETVALSVSNPTDGAALGPLPEALLNINDSSAPPRVSVGDTSALEGASGLTNAVFEVRLSVPCSFPVSVDFETVDGTATADSGDYLSASGTLIFAPGEIVKAVEVSIKGDRRFEPDETFKLRLSNASPEAASVNGPDGTATIRNDDPLPPSVLVVNTTDDEDDGHCDTAHCSLREAVGDANANPDDNRITFNIPHADPGYDHRADAYVIKLKSGELSVVASVTVEGSGAPRLSVRRDSTAADSRLFNIATGAVLKLSHLTVAGGRAESGGGIYSLGDLTLDGVTLTDNRASARGGALASEAGTLYVFNSTVSGNFADGDGGGLYVGAAATAVLTNATVAENRADADADADGAGGGIALGGGVHVTLRNTIVAGNLKGVGAARDDVFGSLDAASAHNLVGIASGLPLDAMLGPLADNGGMTPTHLPLAGSPALDAGDNSLATGQDGNPLTDEQRGEGFARVVGGTVDIGAVEANYFVNATAGTPQSATIGTAFPAQFRVTVKESGFAREGVEVTFDAPASGAGGTFDGEKKIVTVTSGAGGVADAPVFNANTNAGAYEVTAAIGKGSPSTVFKLTNVKMQGQVSLANLSQRYDGQPKTVTVTTTPAGLPFVVTYEGSATPPTSVGTYKVSAIIEDPHYEGSVTGTLVVAKAAQAITFAALADRTYGDSDFTLSASASSGLAPTFAAAGSCTINGQTLHLGGAGACTVTASQAGNENYSVAEAVSRAFSVAKAATATALTSSPNPAVVGKALTFTAVVTSAAGTPAGSVQFKIDGENFSGPIALDAGGTAVLITSGLPAGSHTVTAEYGGGANFNASTGALGGRQVVGTFFEFSRATYTASERAGSVTITVRRTGDTGAAASVEYATDDGSLPSVAVPCSVVTGLALERCDYTRAAGTLRFAAGEAEQTFEVLLSDDSYVEGPETLRLTLSNPSGAELGAQSAATLQLTDDAQESSGNPSDDSEAFVREHYHDFLNREPDASGLAFWKGEIEGCGADAQCREMKRVNVSAAFFLSIEFQETGYFVYRTYKVAYGDATSTNVDGTVPSVRFREFMGDTQRIGQGVQVNVGDWQQRLETNKQAYALDFVGRQRFLEAFPATLTAEEFVTKLDRNAGQVLSSDEKAQLISTLDASPADASKRAAALRLLAEYATLRQRELNRAFVLMEYFGYLRRSPDEAPDTDFRGWKFWLGKLEEFNGDYIRAEMVKAFNTSDEYRRRFGQ